MILNEKILAKIVTLEQLESRLHHWKVLGNKVVFTNGCFDLLHLGHLSLLAQAASLGDYLVVGLNSDSSVKLLKGNDRPLQDQDTRAALLASMECVDAVVIFEEETPLHLIEKIVPAILVKGGDYNAQNIVGADFITASGGEVKIVELIAGKSTTALIQQMKKG